MISVKLLKKSINKEGIPLLSFLLEYPKLIHTHVLTHREFSRNASSGRATPASVSITKVADADWYPILRMNTSGMVGLEPSLEEVMNFRHVWAEAKEDALKHAKKLADMGVHKTHINDLLFPFEKISVIMTGNTFQHFYNQRCDKAAREETRELALAMKKADESTDFTFLNEGEWHTLFSDNPKEDVAICARVSRNKADKSIFSLEENLALYNKLAASKPLHASCFEHTCMNMNNWHRYGNKTSWRSMREDFNNEYTGKLP